MPHTKLCPAVGKVRLRMMLMMTILLEHKKGTLKLKPRRLSSHSIVSALTQACLSSGRM